MHRVTASEKHGIWHPRSIEMGSFRTSILSRVNVRPNDVAVIIYVIAEYARDVVCTFRKHRVNAWRSRKTRLTSGDSCFADHCFAFVKVSFLLADVDDDPRLSGSAFAVPPACGSGARIEAGLIRCWVLFATANHQRREQRF